MSNPHDPNSAQWAAWEKEQARRTGQSSTGVGQQEIKRMEAEKGSQNHGNGCFPAGSMVRTPYGDQPIETLAAGELVVSLSVKSRELEMAPILKKACYSNNEITEIKFENGATIRTTRSHSFLSDNGWKKTSDLNAGDNIATGEFSKYQKVLLINHTSKQEPVFNLVTARHNNFIVDGFVAHNFSYFRKLRSFYWRLVDIFTRKNIRVRKLTRRSLLKEHQKAIFRPNC